MTTSDENLNVITTTAQLEEVCLQFSKDPFITVDTEFMRETTFWPILCLIQIAGANTQALIDPLADNISLDPFYALMADNSVIKVFHAARQDIEIIYTQGGLIPTPMFDTQIAAMVCGFGDSVGYESLIRTLLDKGIDKTSRFTDWSRRPLSPKQLAYALGDVTHLLDAYVILEKKLADSGRAHWLAEEMATLESPDTYKAEPENAWKRLKFNANSKLARAIFMEVAAWREQMAQSQNVPRNRILKDDALREIALQRPKDKQALDDLRAVPRGFSNSSRSRGLLEAVEKANSRPDSDIFPAIKNGPPRAEIGPITEMLKVLLKIVCTEQGVAPKLIASTAELEKIAHKPSPDIRALNGWRAEIFGDQALALISGKLAIALDEGKPVLVERP